MNYLTYYYFDNKKLPIKITEKSVNLKGGSFTRNNPVPENESIFNFFKDINNEHFNIIDIGAHHGSFSLYAKYLPNCTFYSFEPFLLNYNLLIDNIKLNEIDNIKTFNIGLSDKIGKDILKVSKYNGLHTLGSNPLRFKSKSKRNIEINTNTIDNFFHKRNISVDYIKIDTEGWEYYILKGAELTIKKNKPVIFIEWNLVNMRQCDVNETMIIALFNSYEYCEKMCIGENKMFVHISSI